MSSPTAERILDEAMRLFSEQGFKATTIVQIEAAAGLSSGAGGIYRHFASKEALLTEGVQRHLGRLRALGDVRRVFSGVADVRLELTLMAEFVLNEVDGEAPLLRVLVTEARTRPDLLGAVADQVVGATVGAFAGWLAERAAGPLSEQRALASATVVLSGLLSTRLLGTVGGSGALPADDELIAAWVELLIPMLQPSAGSVPQDDVKSQ